MFLISEKTVCCVPAQIEEGKNLTKAEHMERGSLHKETYMSYVRAAGGWCVVFGVLAVVIINIGFTAFSSWWLALWIQAGVGVSS